MIRSVSLFVGACLLAGCGAGQGYANYGQCVAFQTHPENDAARQARIEADCVAKFPRKSGGTHR